MASRSDQANERLAALHDLIAMASGDWSDPDKRPEDEPHGTCDWGDCDEFAAYWRWSEDHGGWLPVCDYHDLNDA